MRCVICNETKPDGEATVEHIFPEAIGGSLLLKDVCKSCNNYLGYSVDTALTDHYLILVKRAQLGVTGEAGKLPNPLKGTVKDDTGRLVRFETDKDGNPIGFRYINYVGPEDGGRVEVMVDKTNSDELVQIVKKLYERRGLTAPSEEDVRAQVQSVEQLRTATLPVRIDLLEYQRAIIKIAFELGLHWLGPDYLQDETAQKLRKMLFDKSPLDKQFEVALLNGQILLHRPEGEEVWDGPWEKADHLHLAMLFINKDAAFCAIRVFDVVHARIVLSHNPSRWSGVLTPRLMIQDSKLKAHSEYVGEQQVITAITEAKRA